MTTAALVLFGMCLHGLLGALLGGLRVVKVDAAQQALSGTIFALLAALVLAVQMVRDSMSGS